MAQQVLFLSQFCFGIQNLQVEVAVAQTDDDIALLDVRTLFDYLLHHDAAFLGRNLHHLDGHYLSVGAHIVLELSLRYLAYCQIVGIDFQRRGVIAKNQPTDY